MFIVVFINLIFFRRILEKIVIDEQKKGKNISSLIEKDIFHETLYIACLEIVIFSYSSPTKTFPWALETFRVEPFHFYKVNMEYLTMLGLQCLASGH